MTDGIIALPVGTQPLLLTGHVLDVLRTLPASAVQCVVTSPPYWGLRCYGTESQVWGGIPGHVHDWSLEGGVFCVCGAWRGELGLEPTPQLYVRHLVDVFREVRRVLRDDGTVWLNLGDSYNSTYGFGRANEQWHRNGRDGGGANDKKEVRGGILKPKDLVGIPWRVAFALQDDGWYLRSDIVWSKSNPMPEPVRDRPSRSHEYVFLLAKSAKYYYDNDAVRLPYSEATINEMQTRYEGEATKDYDGTGAQNPSDVKRSILSGLGREQDRMPARNANMYAGFNGRFFGEDDDGDRDVLHGSNLRTVWNINIQPYRGAHFATFPEEIPRRAILLGTSEGRACVSCGAPFRRVVDRWVEDQRSNVPSEEYRTGTGQHSNSRSPTDFFAQAMSTTRTTIGWMPMCSCPPAGTIPCLVLDPFAGSGTTFAVARKLGRRSIGIDLNPEYANLVEERPEVAASDLSTEW